MKRVSAASVVAFATACAVAMPAWAQEAELEAARTAFYEANFRRARDLFTELLESPSLTREGATEAYRFLATAELLLRHADRARGHAIRAVALDPDVQPPEGSSSRAGRVFDEARDALGGEALRLRLSSESSDGDGQTVTARLTPDVAELVERVRLRCARSASDPSPRTAEVLVAEAREVELHLAGARARWSCAATAETAHGAVLVRAVHRTESPREMGSRRDRTRTRRHRDDETSGMPLWPWLVGGGAVVVGAIIVGIAVATSGDDLTTIELGPVDVPAWR